MHSKDENGNAVFAGKPRDLFTEGNFRKFERSWDDGRVATAFFRGESPLSGYARGAWFGAWLKNFSNTMSFSS